jgi:hypothetical protein
MTRIYLFQSLSESPYYLSASLRGRAGSSWGVSVVDMLM